MSDSDTHAVRSRTADAATHAAAVADRLATFDRVVEVGIGRRIDVAATLADAGAEVVATDVQHRTVPRGVSFVRDDVTDPDLSVYREADAVYALHLPPELHRPALSIAREVGAELFFTTFGSESPAIPASPETVPAGTLYRARPGPGR